MEVDVKGIKGNEFGGEEAGSVAESGRSQSRWIEGEMIRGTERLSSYCHCLIYLRGFSGCLRVLAEFLDNQPSLSIRSHEIAAGERYNSKAMIEWR